MLCDTNFKPAIAMLCITYWLDYVLFLSVPWKTCWKYISVRTTRISGGVMDETNKQLVAETRVPLPVQPGQPPCFDYEYERHGTMDLFMFTEPLAGGVTWA